jgi:hypothetical protein
MIGLSLIGAGRIGKLHANNLLAHHVRAAESFGTPAVVRIGKYHVMSVLRKAQEFVAFVYSSPERTEIFVS